MRKPRMGDIMPGLFRHLLTIAAVSVAAATLPATAQTADDYPNKAIRIIVAAGAGGPTDVPARLASQILTAKLGQPVVIENRPGAGGALGARAVATSPADGYTLLMGNTSTLAVIPAVSASAGYDPVKDFVPIVKITEGFQILVVHPSSPWKTVQAFVDHTKANPGKLNYAHTGNGGLPHLAGELFMLRSGAKMTGVSYRSGGESNTAVLGQTVDATFENIAILRSLLADGRLRGLAVQNVIRTPLLPELPTMAEAGVPDCEANTFFGLVAPAGTPGSIIAKLNAAINEGMATPEMQRTITGLGSESRPNSPAEFAAFIAAQNRKWINVGQAAGVKVN
jgi:tripartite-type tricarboxylate transporter receptor subunit TctC